MNDNRIYMLKVFRFFLFLFLLLGLYIAYVMVIEGVKLDNDPKNPRMHEDISLRGRIFARNGKPLAITRSSHRFYPMAEATGPLIGYFNERLGKSGLESQLTDIETSEVEQGPA